MKTIINCHDTKSYYNQNIIKKYSQDSVEEIPFIATYYYNPKPYNDEDVIIPYYVTDYNQVEYLYGNMNKNFTITYQVDDDITITDSVKAGNNEINFGKLSPGIHIFSIQAECDGFVSHKLYNEVYVVDRTNYDIVGAQIYTITQDDLDRYGIKNTNSEDTVDMTNTREGLTLLFNEIKNNGYRKCILPEGIYKINEDRDQDDGFGSYNKPIDIPSEFTVDLNNSTIKLYDNTIREQGIIIRMKGCMDSHVINGTIEGSYILGSNPGTAREHLNAIRLIGSKYCSFENLTIKNNNGYTIMTSYGDCTRAVINSNWETNTSVVNGELKYFKNKATSQLTDISQLDMLSVNRFLGYQGFEGNTMYVDIHFYDENENYIETIKSIQYRKVKKPINAKYIRATIDGDSNSYELQATNFETPTNCSFININYKDTWTCAMAPAQYNNLLIKGCTFDNCGHCGINDITPIAIDFEDGWEMGQDCYFINNKVINRAGTADMVTCRGSNYVIEGCTKWRIDFRGGTIAPVFRNNTECAVDYRVSPFRNKSSFGRIYNNTKMEQIIIQRDTDYTGDLLPQKAVVRNCETIKSLITTYHNAQAIDCIMDLQGVTDFTSSTYLTMGGTYLRCTVKNLNAKNACIGNITMYEGTLTNIIDCYFPYGIVLDNVNVSNVRFKTHGYDSVCIIKNSILNNFYLEIPGWVVAKNNIIIDNCNITNDVYNNLLYIGFMNNNIISISNSYIIVLGSLMKLDVKDTSVCDISIINNNITYVEPLINGDTTIGNIQIINENNIFNS